MIEYPFDKPNRVQERIDNAVDGSLSEAFLRFMLEEVARNAPLTVLKAAMQVVVDCRLEELRREGDVN